MADSTSGDAHSVGSINETGIDTDAYLLGDDIEVSGGDETVELGDNVTVSYVPGRMDRLPWTLWHTYFVLALGVSWILDGLEVTTISLIGNVLKDPVHGLGLTQTEVGLCGTVYVCGAVTGSLFFGFLSDRIGRKKLFFVSPSVYLLSTFLTSLTFFRVWLYICLFVTGFGIGGEYSAMNSAINELIPSRIRGAVDILINGTYWLGAAIGGTMTTVLMESVGTWMPSVAWRLPWIIGAVMGVAIFVARIMLPESPRWLLSRGRTEDAERIVVRLERYVARHGWRKSKFICPENEQHAKELGVAPTTISTRPVSYGTVLSVVFKQYKTRAFLSFVLMTAQAFFYNAIFFSYASILSSYFGVPKNDTGLFIIPFAIGNYAGAVILGQFFDRVGRKVMIAGTYTLSAVLLTLSGVLFVCDVFNAVTQTLAWSVVFFVASSAASSAYLTVSEIFPAEVRAVAIAIFYSSGTALGGMIGPLLFSALINPDDKTTLFAGYEFVSVLMVFAAIVELLFGVETAGKTLEEISKPVTEEKDNGEV